MTSSAMGRRLGALGLLVAVALSACNDDGTGVESGPITGVWAAPAQGGTLFVLITDDRLTYYTKADAEDCAARTVYELDSLGGNRFRLSSTVNTVAFESTIFAEGGVLTWEIGTGATIFQRSEVDPRQYPYCAGGGDSPAIDCATLPELRAGEAATGELTTGDAAERGWYYDLYSLQPTQPFDGAIRVTGEGIDPYLYVYDASGALVAENDDATEGSLDAGLELQLSPGCYRIEVTSVDPEETGGYAVGLE